MAADEDLRTQEKALATGEELCKAGHISAMIGMPVCVHACLCVFMHVCLSLCLCTHVQMSMGSEYGYVGCKCMYVCMSVCVRVCARKICLLILSYFHFSSSCKC